MARKGETLLDVNDLFPTLHLRSTDNEDLLLPQAMGPGYGVLLLYRGHW